MSITNADLPDFEALAREIANALSVDHESVPEVVRALRDVWNARGSADAKMIEASLSSQMGVTAAGPYVKNLERAVKALDQA